MEKTKKHIEIIVDPVAETTNVTLRNVTGKELVDGYVHAAAAVANAIVKNSSDITGDYPRNCTANFARILPIKQTGRKADDTYDER